MYKNFRCRKCNKIIAQKVNKINLRDELSGILVKANMHKNCSAGIQDDETVLADLISYSETLLQDVVNIIEVIDVKNDVNKAIDDFEAACGVKPHMIIGRNLIKLFTASYNWINEPIDKSEGIIAKYKGISCEYDPNISCVILKA